ncbi:hypothetical protein [Streptomyces sp. SID13726]|uniref:hypothetical protein n=1 Tax=Streptomyces sp. SID13726 TaxID=2706058 RepID=UPI0013B9D97C|nr:hypothetical protein [Streptomyces sp. SID13726]NEB00603.1 hypothetical protein [Streptomyces sp. SID13726]
MHPFPRPAPPNGPGHCPRCGSEVIWCVTVNQKAQMVDRPRNQDGNQAVRCDRTGRWLVRQLSSERPTPEADERLHMPHIATCTVPPPRQPRPSAPRNRGIRPVRWQR